MKMKIKEKTEAVFVRESMKTFLEKKKIDLKKENGKFYGIPETLMYYLEDSELFRKDWLDYLGVKEGTKNILEFMGSDLLILLTNYHS